MYRVDSISRWRMHYSGPDFTGIIKSTPIQQTLLTPDNGQAGLYKQMPIIFAIFEFLCLCILKLCLRSILCACREASRFAGETGKVTKLHHQRSSSWFTGFLCCVQVLHCVEHIDILYVGVRVYYN